MNFTDQACILSSESWWLLCCKAELCYVVADIWHTEIEERVSNIFSLATSCFVLNIYGMKLPVLFGNSLYVINHKRSGVWRTDYRGKQLGFAARSACCRSFSTHNKETQNKRHGNCTPTAEFISRVEFSSLWYEIRHKTHRVINEKTHTYH